jgi:hypothetical protein
MELKDIGLFLFNNIFFSENGLGCFEKQEIKKSNYK